jgi:hypothetical protein
LRHIEGVERRGLRDLQIENDVSQADWVVGGVESSGRLVVGSLVPEGFAGYARLFHPAYHFETPPPAQEPHPPHEHLGHDHESEVRWDTIAQAGQWRAHAGMQWSAISADGPWDEEPEIGSLPIAQATHLLGVLRRFTDAEECFYAVWEGFGALAVPVEGVPHVEMPARSMVLLRGPLADAADVSMDDWPWQQSPSLWWPADRAWCVATDVDQNTTYIGAGRDCVEALVATPALEVWAVERDQSLTADSDELNRTASAASAG